MKKTLIAALVPLIASSATVANAQSVIFNSPSQYDSGSGTAVATNGNGAGLELEVHLGGPLFNNYAVWRKTGEWSTWFSGGQVPGSGSADCLGGGTQDCATAVSAAGDSASSSSLFTYVGSQILRGGDSYQMAIDYRTGTMGSTGSMTWNSSGTLYGQGNCDTFYPTVAQASMDGVHMQFVELNNGCIAVSPPYANSQLYYTTGTLNIDGKTINWNSPVAFPGTAGYGASVAMWPMHDTNGNPLSTYFVVEEHTVQNGGSAMYYTTGVLTPGSSTIAWDLPSAGFDNGISPHIAVCSEDNKSGGAAVIDVHNGGGQGWYKTGRINGHYINWQANGHEYDVGSTMVGGPSVACTQNWGVETHENSSGQLISTKFTEN